MLNDFKHEKGENLCYSTCARGKKIALSKIDEFNENSFRKIEALEDAVISDGGFAEFTVTDTGQFEAFYMSPKSCIEGFKTCPQLLAVDACFIKTKYKGSHHLS